MTIKEKIESRERSNKELFATLGAYLAAHPQVRFGQALVNIGIVQYDVTDYGDCKVIDPFHEESVDMLKRIGQ